MTSIVVASVVFCLFRGGDVSPGGTSCCSCPFGGVWGKRGRECHGVIAGA